MAQTNYTPIKIYNSLTTGTTPATNVQGELAINITDKKLWVGNGTSNIQLLGAGAAMSLSTLTLSSSLTLSGGTINGVAYVNGSNVLTTGTALTFDGAKLTIGTATAAGALTVLAGASTGYGTFDAPTAGFAYHDYKYNGTRYGLTGQSSALYSGGSNTDFGILASSSLIFGSGGVKQLTLDTAGNLGLGVTPSASGSSYKNIQVGQSSVLCGYSSGNYLWLGSNWTNNTGDKYITTDYATLYGQQGGKHIWWNAPSGTAGNTISFTQAMTLDASGQLVIGDTTADTKFNLVGGTARISGTRTAGSFLDITPNNTGSNGVTLGVSYYGSGSYGPLKFSTGGSEAARIDSSGNLLMGVTSFALSNSNSIMLQPSAGTIYAQHASGTASGTAYVGFSYNGSNIGSITQNGTTGVLYNLTSDYRLKNNPEALTGAKDFIMALQPKKWQWWDGSGEGVGFIAHEFMEVAKYSGQGEKDAVEIIEIKDEDGNVTGTEERPVYQSIQPSSSEVMANLVAHIQELETRLAALEAK